jgi:hypothetical protein
LSVGRVCWRNIHGVNDCFAGGLPFRQVIRGGSWRVGAVNGSSEAQRQCSVSRPSLEYLDAFSYRGMQVQEVDNQVGMVLIYLHT